LVRLRSSQNSEIENLYYYDFEKIEFGEKPPSDYEFEELFHFPFNGYDSIQASISPSHEEKGVVSCTPFQVFEFYDASLDDLEE
jgi:hypothetical protein